jgi:hypothetical protein
MLRELEAEERIPELQFEYCDAKYDGLPEAGSVWSSSLTKMRWKGISLEQKSARHGKYR